MKIKVLQRSASENRYLHKDFHGALCYAIKYLDDTYGHDATTRYLQQVGESVFSPLIAELKQKGLGVLEQHWKAIFDLEEGNYDLKYDGDVLVLTVHQCPAIQHLKNRNQLYTDRYCETTVVVNETICSAAGYKCVCNYELGVGRCVQKFWKPKE
jgi:hypothetical protein